MLLSIIIPTLNRPKTACLLGERLAELLSDIALEVIVVTPQATPVSTPTTRFIRDTRKGIYSAFNQGIKAAEGTYVWLLGDDDYPLDGIQSIIPELHTAAADLIIAPVIYSDGRRYTVSRSRLRLLVRNWCQQGLIYKRSALLRYRLYGRLRIEADHYSNVLINADPAMRKVFAEKPICVFNAGGASSRSGDEKFRRLRPLLARRTLGNATYPLFCLWDWAANLRRQRWR
jgi:glycosyltransferase involved in cell wall biosynthesis